MYKIRSKKAFKKFAGKCVFCEERDYATLDVHRILEGYNGGKYDCINCVCVCANHHRKIHDGSIKVIKKHRSYGESLYVLECIIDNQVEYISMNY